ncbi:MAG: biotin--[acetyl-CoA-carboxylase] ligase [Longimicrobiales bacterium]
MTAGPTARSWLGHDAGQLERRWRVPRVLAFERVGSTNDIARRLAERGAAPGTVVIAATQTAGRGRLGRRWHDSPGASLLLSVVLRPPSAAHTGTTGPLPLRVGLACARALERTIPLAITLKWPNDLLLDDRKVGGILCEAALAPSGGFIVAGVGINVAQTAQQLPSDLRADATSLTIATGRAIRVEDVADAVLPQLQRLATQPLALLDREEARELVRRDVCAGRQLTVDAAGHASTLRGTGAGIELDGRLRIRLPDGRLTRVAAGTVRLDAPTLTTDGTA